MDKTIQKFFADILGEGAEASSATSATSVEPAEPVKSKPVKEAKPVAVNPKPVAVRKVDPKLAAYVADELKQGISAVDIKKGLLAAHWPEKDVDAALLLRGEP